MSTEQKTIDKATALAVYKAPFSFECGYIFDANHNMVADEPTSADDPKDAKVRMRGWGRISYMPSPELLQDTIGQHIANALTEYWTNGKDALIAQLQARAEKAESELASRDALIKDHLAKIMHLENRFDATSAKLEKPVRIGNVNFQTGVKLQTALDAGHRRYLDSLNPEVEAERLKTADAFVSFIRTGVPQEWRETLGEMVKHLENEQQIDAVLWAINGIRLCSEADALLKSAEVKNG